MRQFVVSITKASLNMQSPCCVVHHSNNVALLDSDWNLT